MASAPFSFLLISALSWAHQWTQTTAAIFSWTCWPAGGSVGATHFQQVRFRVTYGLYTTDCRLARVAPTTAIGGQQLANLFKKSISSTLPISSAGRGHLLLHVKEKTESETKKLVYRRRYYVHVRRPVGCCRPIIAIVFGTPRAPPSHVPPL
jgi:hypothetical protein